MISRYLASVGTELRRLGSRGRGRILFVVALGWGLTVGGRMVYPVLLPHLRVSFDLDLAAAGLLLSFLFVAYALGQLPGGVLADRVGERLTLTLSVGLSGLALVLLASVGTTGALFGGTILLGFAVGLYAIGRFTAVATLYPEGYGTAVGVLNVAPAIGQALLPPLAGVVAVLVGWRAGFGFLVPAFVLVALSLWLVVPVRDADAERAVDSLSLGTVRHLLSVLRDPAIVLATTVMILGISVWQAFTGFYPTYLIEEKGLSSTAASLLFGIYFAATAFMHPISGLIYDRLDVRYTLGVVGVAAVSLAALPFVDSIWILGIVSILLGTLLAFETSTESYLVATLPAEVQGTGFGVLRTTVFAVGAISPVAFGAVAERGFFDEVFFVFAGLAAVVVVLGTRLPVVDR